jgi:LacI family transcriptional regulator
MPSTRVDRPQDDGRSGRVTRGDVARHAGVSSAVVSYVVNDGPRAVAPATRARVVAAIDELGYRPNTLARSLRARRSYTFGLLVPNSSNPFFSELGRAVEDAGFEAGYTLLFGNSMDDERREDHYVRTFLERQVDGLILISVSHSESLMTELATSRLPTVLLQTLVPRPSIPTVLVDNEGGALAAVRHLLEHGHETVACLTGPEGIPAADERLRGWADALDEAGVPERQRVAARATFGRPEGYRAALDLLRESSPTAVFVASDEQAFGVLRAAADLGLRVPDDLAIVAFDGLAHSEFTVPGLTTVSVPFAELGTAAVGCLVDQIEGRTREQSAARIQVRLVRRGSCGCPDRQADGP